ncbi:Latrophilin-2 [Aphelenchoides besseyi]|nr:Latrophilin-2 [Aphelenchoides besseyi]
MRWKLAFFVFFLVHSVRFTEANKKLQVCEGEMTRLECSDELQEIEIQLANFGRFSVHPCNPLMNTDYSTTCLNNATKEILAKKCNGRSSCEFFVDATVLGDPCPGIPKYLDAMYTCVFATTTAPPSTTAEPEIDEETRSVAPTDDQVNYEVVTNHKNEQPPACAAVFYRAVQWTQTIAGEQLETVCPLGSHGKARRFCRSNGQWSEEVDLSDCITTSFRSLQKDLQQTWKSDFLVPIELLEDVQKHVRHEKLLGGDLIELAETLSRIQNHNHRFPASVHNQPQLSTTAKITIEMTNELLQVSQRDGWIDLSPRDKTSTAQTLLFAVQRSLQNLAESMAEHKSVNEQFVSRPTVLGIAAVSRSKSQVELPESTVFDIEDRVLFSLPTTNSPINSEFKLSFTAIANLGGFLIRDAATSQVDECRRTVVSKLLSTWSEVRSLTAGDSTANEPIPTVLSFSTKRKVDPEIRIQCARWSTEDRDFVADGSCVLVETNSTTTICRCIGSGDFAVVSSTCDAQIFSGFNKESIALYMSCALAAFGLLVYIAGMVFVDERPKYPFIPRSFCVAIIFAEFFLSLWFLLPRHGTLASIIFYLLHAAVFIAVSWILLQFFQFTYSLVQLLNGRKLGAHVMHYVVGYGLPVIMITFLAFSSGNFSLFLRGFQPLQRPSTSVVFTPLILLISLHLVFALFTTYLLVKRSAVGYMPCRTDAETITSVRQSFVHSIPLIVSIDTFCLVVLYFVSTPVTFWLWMVVAANLLQTLFTLRVLSFKRLFSGELFWHKNGKKLRADNLPKTSVFSPIVQGHPNHNSSINFSYNEPVSGFAKRSNASLGHFFDDSQGLPAYIPTVGGVHDAHCCDHTYATIPQDYYAFQQQHYRIYQQHPGNPSQVQLPPIPPVPSTGFSRASDIPVGFSPHGVIGDMPQSPLCNEHGHRCASMAALRLSNTQLYNNQSSSHQRPPSDVSYETARSSSTAGTTASAASSGTLLLRMDLTQNPPIFLDENS